MARNFSNEPDAAQLIRLRTIESVALCIAAAIASCILVLWFVPGLDRVFPSFWSKMTANMAICLLLSAGCLARGRQPLSPLRRRLGMAAAVFVLLIGTLTLLEYATHMSFGFDALLPHHVHGPFPGRLSPQTSLALSLLGLCILTVDQAKNLWSRIADIAVLSLLTINFIMLGGEFFGALDQFSISSRIIISPQTVLAFFCFSTAIMMRRAEQGDMLAVLVNVGIGSRMIRLILPLALFMPFGLLAAEAYLYESGLASAPYAQSIVAAISSILVLCLVTWSGWRINALERDLRDLSLTDELTGVYNRRGFYFLGQQAIRESQRAGTGLSLFFFDLDGLKHVNDMQGHEAGSEMIKDFAEILRDTFRRSDIIGRVGGDEFAVITMRDDATWTASVRARLESLTDAHNGDAANSYRLSFSTGYTELDHVQAETLDSLVTRADGLMYQDKAKRKATA
jgi:diguanylate cyclase (GGDEF)-like protein